MIDIYVIEDGETVVYVGQSVNVEERKNQHRRTAKRSNQHLYVWMREHPNWTMRTIETVETPNQARTAERAWVRKYLDEGLELMNVVYGAKKPTDGTPEDRMKARKHRALKAKRDSATAKGVSLTEGALIAVRGKEFSVYEWNEEKEEYLATLTGTLD